MARAGYADERTRTPCRRELDHVRDLLATIDGGDDDDLRSAVPARPLTTL
jgi:hypothetical protein